MKLLVSLIKWIVKNYPRKKQPQLGKIEVVNSKIVIIIHKD